MNRAMHRRAFLQAGAATFVAGSAELLGGPVAAFRPNDTTPASQPIVNPATASESDGKTDPIPIVDTHQHLWDLKRFNLPWLAAAPDTINRDFLLEEFRQAVAGLNVEKTVYMEVDVHPAQQVQEAEFAVGLCKTDTLVAGAVIGGTPQEKTFADYLRRFEGLDCIKGVRTVLHGDRPRGLCLEPTFIDSMRRLGDAGLSFDLCLRPGELHDGAKLAAEAPRTTFILDHCGNIGTQSDVAVRTVWCEGIKAVAAQPNAVCKISGLVDKSRDDKRSANELAANIDYCLDAFGEDRVVYGGDWPVCLLGGDYRDWLQSLEAVVRTRSTQARRKLFHDNAVKIYRLG